MLGCAYGPTWTEIFRKMETLEHTSTSITAQKEPNKRSDGENAGGAQEFLPDCIRMNKHKRCSKQGAGTLCAKSQDNPGRGRCRKMYARPGDRPNKLWQISLWSAPNRGQNYASRVERARRAKYSENRHGNVGKGSES